MKLLGVILLCVVATSFCSGEFNGGVRENDLGRRAGYRGNRNENSDENYSRGSGVNYKSQYKPYEGSDEVNDGVLRRNNAGVRNNGVLRGNRDQEESFGGMRGNYGGPNREPYGTYNGGLRGNNAGVRGDDAEYRNIGGPTGTPEYFGVKPNRGGINENSGEDNEGGNGMVQLELTGIGFDGPAVINEKVSLFFTPDMDNAVYIPLKHLRQLMTYPKFDKTKPTVIYMHGWRSDGMMDESALTVRGAYLDRGDHNVLTVDWSYYAKNIIYSWAVPQLKIVSEAFAEQLLAFIDSGYPINQLHLVGHSLGGQMIGKVARHLKKLTNGRLTIPKLIALDPAGPHFEYLQFIGFDSISKTDADFVQIIHTCGGMLGMKKQLGHVDFYPDGGQEHPGCDTGLDVIGCNHARSWKMYESTVRDPKNFPAIKCNSYNDFVNSQTCDSNDIAYMGFGALETQTGEYYLQTRANEFSLSRGMDGTQYTPFKVEIMKVRGGSAMNVPLEKQNENIV